MNETIRNIEFDDRIESYEGFIPDGWAKSAFAVVKPGSVLDAMTMDLMIGWRTTAYTASMPGVHAKSIQSSLHGSLGAPTRNLDIVVLAESVLKRMSRAIPELVSDRGLRTRLLEELVKTADELRVAESTAKARFELPVAEIWSGLLREMVFGMSVWSSQRVAFVAFYNTYEAFLVDCLKRASGTTQLRASDKKAFNEALRVALGRDISGTCWSHHEINIARLVRHALSHAGGRETADLKKQKHGIRRKGGVLQVFPEDNKRMLGRLCQAVEELVALAAARTEFSVSC